MEVMQRSDIQFTLKQIIEKVTAWRKGLRLFTQTVNVVNTETVRNSGHHYDHHPKPVRRQ